MINFTPMERSDYQVGVPHAGSYKLICDETGAYVLEGKEMPVFRAVRGECDGRPYHISQPLRPYGIQIYEFGKARGTAKKRSVGKIGAKLSSAP